MTEETEFYANNNGEFYVSDWTNGHTINSLPITMIALKKSKLIITDDYIVYSSSEIPNWWYRMWYRILLGWKWEEA